ncbi:MAG: hypothetical protein P8N09_13285 [Planctomycetota bacterium]|nr:hypothetical protein [Planctomycetota bacterium]
MNKESCHSPGGSWTLHRAELSEGVLELRIQQDGVPLSLGQFISLLCECRSFRVFFDRALSSAPFDAMFWEMPAVTRLTLEQPFRCVLLNAPVLNAAMPDPHVFSAKLEEVGSSGVGVFPNLGGDALLVVPAAYTDDAAYPHLVVFLRKAPAEQRDAFWAAVGEAVQSKVGAQPLWLSTSGLGVAWLHVRLDVRPKYYVHEPYRTGTTRPQ